MGATTEAAAGTPDGTGTEQTFAKGQVFMSPRQSGTFWSLSQGGMPSAIAIATVAAASIGPAIAGTFTALATSPTTARTVSNRERTDQSFMRPSISYHTGSEKRISDHDVVNRYFPDAAPRDSIDLRPQHCL
jgi:hypothetical protein